MAARQSMRLVHAVLVVCVLFNANPVQALEGIAMAWSHCPGEPLATQNAVFACNTNVGTHDLMLVFRVDSPTVMIGADLAIDITTASPSLPAWWQYRNAGSCRTTSLSYSLFPAEGDDSCMDWSEGGASGVIFGYCTAATGGGCFLTGPIPENLGRVGILVVVPIDSPKSLLPGQNYFVFSLRVNHAKTTGVDSCDGCQIPACLAFPYMQLESGNQVSRVITAPLTPGGNFVTWQGGGGTNCPAATPVRNSTWGGVKALYR